MHERPWAIAAAWIVLAAICLLYAVFALAAAAGLAESEKIRNLESAFAAHAVAGAIALMAGVLQVNSGIRRKAPRLHRRVGGVYIVCVMIAGVTGMASAAVFDASVPTKVSFWLLGAIWMSVTVIAFLRIRQRDFADHAAWMVRSFALALFFVSFSIWVPILGRLLPGETGFAIAVTLGWVVNLVIAEAWIRLRMGPGRLAV
jgi:hypothetical protein